MRMLRVCVLGFVVAAMLFGVAQAQPVIIAHRGASGYLPEHTLEAYSFAYAEGADYLEPDLVMTKDGHLVALHDTNLETTTDVAERFPGREREDDKWYAADFTLEEIKTLRVHERMSGRFPVGLSRFEVATFEEIAELVQGLNASTGRDVGIYPELKQPSFHRREGLDIAAALVPLLRAYDYDREDARVYVQCFEHATLRRLRDEFGVKAPMVALVGGGAIFNQMVTDEGLAAIAEFAQGIGPDKHRVYDDPDLVRRAQAHGLVVHPYTLRADRVPGRFDDFEQEMHTLFVEIGADGAFTDYSGLMRDFVRTMPAETAVAP